MKVRKWLTVALTLVLALTVALCIVSCNDNPENPENPDAPDTPDTPDTPDAPVEGPETGTYYYDDFGREFLISLSGGKDVSFKVKSADLRGTYAKDGETITFTFTGLTVSATYRNDRLRLEYDGSTMEFLRKTDFTVTFDSDGGSEVAAVTAVNGRTISRPDAPTKSGYTFVGWYLDEEHRTAFMFDSQRIFSNTVLYAYWIKNNEAGVPEYVVDFDIGYDGGEYVDELETIGGIIPELPVPAARSGYVFDGWYVSDSDDANKLTYKYDREKLEENVTMYAVWTAVGGEKLPAPSVSVKADGISWTAVSGAVYYTVKIDDGEGQTVEGLTYAYDFGALTAGEHKVEVVAASDLAEKDSEAAVRYYTVNRLARVSVFKVLDGDVLSFYGVNNATKYLLTVNCGTEGHHTEAIDLGNNTAYNFSNCDMKKGGIEFTVTAQADGYVDSVSRTFVLERNLKEIKSVSYQAKTDSVEWDAVENATSYIVKVVSGSKVLVNNENVGNVTSYCLKNVDADKMVVSVYPVAKGYNSPAPTTFDYARTNLVAPSDLRVDGTTLKWNSVRNATSYEININGIVVATVTDAKYDLTEIKTNFTVSVRAKADGKVSVWSDEEFFNYLSDPTELSYNKGTFTWNKVLGAASYEVRVNGGDVKYVKGSSAVIAFTQAGNNTLEVRFVTASGNEADKGSWASLIVIAYEIRFNENGGSALDKNAVYLAHGDDFTLPTTTRTGYTFAGWYDSTNVATAKRYESGEFGADKDITLYACWTANTYSVSLDGNKPVELANEQVQVSATTADVVYGSVNTLPVPSFAGYKFLGWYTAAVGGDKIADENGNTVTWEKAGDDEILYAHWAEILNFVQPAGASYYFVEKGAYLTYYQITEITIPRTYNGLPVERIADGAFKDCTALEVINIYDSVKSIGITGGDGTSSNGPFAGCTSLKEINVLDPGPDSAYISIDGILIADEKNSTGLKSLAFVPASRFVEFTVPYGVQRIPTKIFANSTVQKVIIPATVEEIAANAFYNCKNLKTVEFAGLDSDVSAEIKALKLYEYAFRFCKALEEVTLPKRVGEFDAESVFDNCSALTALNVADGNALYKSADGILCNASYEAIYCPYGKAGEYAVNANITAIGEGSFAKRNLLTKVIIPATVSEIKANAFADCAALREAVFAGSEAVLTTAIGSEAFRKCSALATITFENGSKVVSIGEYAFADNAKLSEVSLPASLTVIADYAFSNCINVKKVTINASESASLGSKIFADCSLLTTIELSAAVNSVTTTTFGGCYQLKQIVVDEGNATYASENGILYNKDKTELIYCAPKNIVSSLPETVTAIRANAFENGELTSMVIGKNVTSIGDYAFNNCAKLATLTFESGRVAALTVGAYAFNDCVNVTALALPATLTAVGSGAFKNAGKNVGRLVLTFAGEGETSALTVIGESAFENGSFETLVIPASVTAIGADAFKNGKLTSVTFETAALTTIEESAFANNATLATLVLPTSGLTEIKENAFYGATALTELTVPASVTAIKAGAFYGAEKVTAVTFAEDAENSVPLTIADGENNGYGAFGYMTSLTSIILPSRLTYVGDYAFYNAKNVSSVTLSESLTYIGKEAFMLVGASATTAESFVLNVPASVTAIGDGAFKQTKFGSATFANGAERLTIGANAFESSALTTITLPNNLASLGENAFASCSALVSFDGSNLSDLNANGFKVDNGILYAYESGKLSAYYIPASFAFDENETFVINADVTALPANAFKGTSIKNVDLNNVTEIGAYAFAGTAITSINLGKVTVIGANAFENCTALTEVVAKNVVEIGDSAFNGASSLVKFNANEDGTAVNIPSTVTTVGNYAFYGAKLASLNIGSEGEIALTIGDYAFANNGFNALTIPARVSSVGDYAFSNAVKNIVTTIPATEEGAEDVTETTVATLTFDERTSDLTVGNYAFANTDVEEVVFPENMTAINGKWIFYNGKIKTLSVPSTVTVIGENAFAMSYELTTLTIADGTEDLKIMSNAFDIAQKLESVVIPARVTEIGSYAFRSTSSMTSITFAEGSRLKTIGQNAFDSSAITAIALPEGLTTIGQNAFEKTAFTEITVPDSVTTVGRDLFKGNTVLTTVNLGKSEAEFFGENEYSIFSENKSITTVIADSANTKWYTSDGVLYRTAVNEETGNNEVTLAYYPRAKTGETFEIPANVNKIKGYAFKGVTALNAVSFAEEGKVSYIGSNAFAGCTALTSFSFPASVAYIGDNAFNGCSQLASITFEDGDTPLVIGIKDEIDENGNIGTKQNNTFKGTVLTEVTFPARLEYIGGDSFSYLGTLEMITFAASDSELTGIGFSAFSGVSNATFVNFDKLNKLTYIGIGAFNNTTALTEITLPGSLKIIGKEAFVNSGLTSVSVPASVTDIGENAFGGLGLTSFVWESDGNSVYKIGLKALYNNASLATVVLPEGLTEIPDGASNSGTFGGTTALKSIVLPSTLKKIGAYAFYMSGLETLDLSNSSVETIGEYAFADSADLRTAELEGSPVNTIKASAFAGTAITEFTMPSELIDLDISAFASSVKLSVSRYNYYFRQEGNVILENATGSLVYLDKSKIDGKFTFPDGIAEVSDGLFKDCVALTEIVLPDSVTKIGDDAFNGCANLTAVTFPVNLEHIGKNAFKGTALTSVTIGMNVTRIDDYAFDGITALASLTFEEGGRKGLTIGRYAFNGTGITGTLVIPNRTRNVDFDTIGIDNCAFMGTKITKLVIESGTPVGLEDRALSVGRRAFAECKSLTEVSVSEIVGVTYNGDIYSGRWRKAFDHQAFYGCTALTTFEYPVSNYNSAIMSGYPEGIIVGNYLFYNCTSLKKAILPATLLADGSRAKTNTYTFGFENRTFDERLTYNSGSEVLGAVSKDTTAMLGASCDLFYKCSSLEYVEIGTLGAIGKGATKDVGVNVFNDCSSTLKVVIITGEHAEFNSYVSFGNDTKVFVSKDVSSLSSVPSTGAYYTDATTQPAGWSDTVWSGMTTTGMSRSQFLEMAYPSSSSESGEAQA